VWTLTTTGSGKAATHSDLCFSFHASRSSPPSSVPRCRPRPRILPSFPSSHITSPKLLVFVFRSVGSICPRVPSALTVKVPPQPVLRQFVSISDDTCFKTHSPLAVGVPSVGLRPPDCTPTPGNPRNTISKNSGPVGNYSCRQWGIIIVVDGSSSQQVCITNTEAIRIWKNC
jgi:hypothetical protein